MDKQQKRIFKLSKQLVDIERTLKRIEKLVVWLYEHRFSDTSYNSRPPPELWT